MSISPVSARFHRGKGPSGRLTSSTSSIIQETSKIVMCYQDKNNPNFLNKRHWYLQGFVLRLLEDPMPFRFESPFIHMQPSGAGRLSQLGLLTRDNIQLTCRYLTCTSYFSVHDKFTFNQTVGIGVVWCIFPVGWTSGT